MGGMTSSVALSSTSSKSVPALLAEGLKLLPPVLSNKLYKGQAGRVAIFGGSEEYTGAPYFAGISALKTGADLAYIVSPREAAQAIKSYSPELIVYPTLYDPAGLNETLLALVDRVHAVVLGPGLGRTKKSLCAFATVLNSFKHSNKPVVIDADGLFFVAQHPTLVQGFHNVVLTPNIIEFSRIYESVYKCKPDEDLESNVKSLCSHLDGPSIVCKGQHDVISNGVKVLTCDALSSGRRCGGQGDLLSGALATTLHWATSSLEKLRPQASHLAVDEYGPTLLASYAACLLTKECNRLAFQSFGRSTTTHDMIQMIHLAVQRVFET